LSEWISEQKSIKNKSDEKHEEECAIIVKGILQGLYYTHDEYELIHRDIKPDNILFKHKGDLNSIKICDFGLASAVGIGFFDQNDDNAGTLIYQAPEQIQSTSYGKKIDIWATGMITYEIITKGGHPVLGIDFYNDLKMSLDDYRNKMMNISNNESIVKSCEHISPLAIKLLENMLNVSPNHRYIAHRALKHPWITRDETANIPLNMFEEIQMNMKAYEKLKIAQKIAFAMSMINETMIKKHPERFR